MGPRAGLSSVLIAGAIVLLIAIAVGQNMGNRVLGQIATRPMVLPATAIPTSSPTPDDGSGQANAALWKRHEVISVATDPGFPDPRVTPEPPPPETPRPAPKAKPSPKPSPTADNSGAEGEHPVPLYTSPPLPIPLVTGSPEPGATDELPTAATPTPLATGRGAAAVRSSANAKGYPTLPPYSATPSP